MKISESFFLLLAHISKQRTPEAKRQMMMVIYNMVINQKDEIEKLHASRFFELFLDFLDSQNLEVEKKVVEVMIICVEEEMNI
jgi:hypothetical protein